MAAAVTQLTGASKKIALRISAASSAAKPRHPATPVTAASRYRPPSAATASSPMSPARARPATTQAGPGVIQAAQPRPARLVSSAATQQAPTTGPNPSSLRAACLAGFTRAKPAAISSAGPNSATAAVAAASGASPRDR